MTMRPFAFAAMAAAIPPALAAADYALAVTETVRRDYYCAVTLSLTNRSAAPLDDLNGFLLSFVDGEQVGRSKGGSFRSLAPGEAGVVTLETPNAPCDAVTAYRFVVGACLQGGAFVDRHTCAARIKPVAPIAAAVAR